jgi:tetratricopeptide (TPR) repeat protein
MRVLRRLVHISRKPADLNNLMRALIEIGDPEEALAVFSVMGEGTGPSCEYIDALIRTGDYPSAAESALALYRTKKDPDMLRKHLDALSRYDPASSLDAYPAYLEECPDAGLLCDYIRLLQSTGNDREALAATKRLLARDQKPAYRLLECDLLARNGEDESALAAYEHLIRDELAAKNDLEELARIIDHYREFLLSRGDPAGSKKRFLDLVSSDVNVASLIGTARFCRDCGDAAEARSWFYRAYRADFFLGGLAYARFLIEEGDDRECEKVMLYILANVKKGSDLTRVAAAIVDENKKMFRLRRLMDQLVRRLEERRPQLHSDGLDLLAMAYFITASNALEEMDFAGCKYLCLSGMDILPAPSRTLRLEDFLTLVRACKERSVADRPALHSRPQKKKKEAVPRAEALIQKLGLTEPEQEIVSFLQAHRKATEMDLRKVLGTRRVVGMVNLLIRKAAGQGISIIEKKGVGEEGEVYEYTGT